MKVKIDFWRPGQSGGWYKDLKGNEFEVIEEKEKTYRVAVDGETGDIIKGDCHIVK